MFYLVEWRNSFRERGGGRRRGKRGQEGKPKRRAGSRRHCCTGPSGRNTPSSHWVFRASPLRPRILPSRRDCNRPQIEHLWVGGFPASFQENIVETHLCNKDDTRLVRCETFRLASTFDQSWIMKGMKFEETSLFRRERL